jgi:hypothetical protein
MIRRGWMDKGWKRAGIVRVRRYTMNDDIPAVALPAADFDRLLALLEECAGELEAEVLNPAGHPSTWRAPDRRRYERDMDLPRRVRALLKEVGDGE